MSLVVACACGALIPVDDGEARCQECWRVYVVVETSTAELPVVVEQELD